MPAATPNTSVDTRTPSPAVNAVRKVNRRIIASLALAASVSTLTACGGGGDDGPPEQLTSLPRMPCAQTASPCVY